MPRHPDHPEAPKSWKQIAFEKRWRETASPVLQFVCPDCGIVRDFRKTDEPCFYECLTCGRAVDERLTLSRRKMARWDPR